MKYDGQIGLFDDNIDIQANVRSVVEWPDPDRFPFNLKGTKVKERPDLDAVAEAWLDLIREVWYERLSLRRRFKPLRLKDIRKDLRSKPIETLKIEEAFSAIPSACPIHSRVDSANVGVSRRSED